MERISRSTMSRRDVITSLAVSSTKRIIPSSISCSLLISFLFVNSNACSISSIDSFRFSCFSIFSARMLLRINTFSIGQKSFRATIIPPTACRQNLKGFILLYTFGIISPKRRRRKVSRMVAHNISTQATLNSTTSLSTKPESITIVTFTKLFKIKIVANVRSLSSRSI